MATFLTSVGEEFIVDLIDGTITANPDWIGWGTGAVAPSKASVDLSVPATEARVSATRTQPLADKIQWVATLTCAGTGKTITNAGVFDAAGTGSPPSGGTPLIVHGDFTGVVLAVGDKIEITATLEIT